MNGKASKATKAAVAALLVLAIAITSPIFSAASADEPIPGGEMRLTMRGTVAIVGYDGDAPLRVRWDFGDGVGDVTPEAWHEYTKPGNYTITMRADYLDGSQVVDASNVTIDIPGDNLTAESAPTLTAQQGKGVVAIVAGGTLLAIAYGAPGIGKSKRTRRAWGATFALAGILAVFWGMLALEVLRL